MGKIILLMSLFAFTPLVNVYAADICQGKVINSLKTKDDPNPYYKVGDTITAITQYNYDIENKNYFFVVMEVDVILVTTRLMEKQLNPYN